MIVENLGPSHIVFHNPTYPNSAIPSRFCPLASASVVPSHLATDNFCHMPAPAPYFSALLIHR
jgi:hypothetical protein